MHDVGGRLIIAFKVQQDAIVLYSVDESDDEDKDEDVSRIDQFYKTEYRT